MGQPREAIRDHLSKMPVLANSTNADLSQGFTVSQVTEKHGWTKPMVWSLALEGKEDLERFKELGWGLRIWDQWEWKLRVKPALDSCQPCHSDLNGVFVQTRFSC